ncbi:MAG TPA: threonine dehydratase [Acetobacteraceae bacterium]|jgi:threonine dehydratase|nr:threonine dehydratase [Acetobacteraceae bacterium]
MPHSPKENRADSRHAPVAAPAKIFSAADLEAASALIRAHFTPTRQQPWPLLSALAGAEVWVKHENHTPVGAFKVRGGLVHLDRLRRADPSLKGVISATRGNHGQSLAYAGKAMGVNVTVVVPEGNSTEKNSLMQGFGARLIVHGPDFEAAREEAFRLAAAENLVFVPSFHPDLVLGVATWAEEFFRAAPKLDALYVPIGLGSGICGAIGVRDLLGLATEIIGVQSSGADPYARSLAAGQSVVLNRAETLADGIAVRMPDEAALAIIREGAARIVTVTDEEIADAIRAYWTATHNLAEGAGAAPLAALLKERARQAGKRIGLVLTGGNIDLSLFRSWVLGKD